VDVYPSRRKIWTSILGFAAFVLIGLIAAGSVIANGVDRRNWLVFAAVGFFAWMLVLAIRELRRPVPLAHLDEEGFECALGRVPWANVSAASVRWHWRARVPSQRLFLELRTPAETPGPETREYLSQSPFGGPVAADGQIDLPLWDSKQRVLADVRRFYAAA